MRSSWGEGIGEAWKHGDWAWYRTEANRDEAGIPARNWRCQFFETRASWSTHTDISREAAIENWTEIRFKHPRRISADKGTDKWQQEVQAVFQSSPISQEQEQNDDGPTVRLSQKRRKSWRNGRSEAEGQWSANSMAWHKESILQLKLVVRDIHGSQETNGSSEHGSNSAANESHLKW